jgi:D-beta-D-heptose 7-phosphate kinase/D-beta-D-heptose 1-phosphate adenosyltransferase
VKKSSLVFTNGCFDLLHLGHISLLKYCATLGEVVVGLNSDKSVKRLKGNDRPIINEEDRKEILLAIKYVTAVHIFDEETPLELIKKIRPDIIVKGGDYSLNNVVGKEFAKVLLFPLIEGRSTTLLAEKIIRL